MNLRPSGYEPDELPDCSTPHQISITPRELTFFAQFRTPSFARASIIGRTKTSGQGPDSDAKSPNAASVAEIEAPNPSPDQKYFRISIGDQMKCSQFITSRIPEIGEVHLCPTKISNTRWILTINATSC